MSSVSSARSFPLRHIPPKRLSLKRAYPGQSAQARLRYPDPLSTCQRKRLTLHPLGLQRRGAKPTAFLSGTPTLYLPISDLRSPRTLRLLQGARCQVTNTCFLNRINSWQIHLPPLGLTHTQLVENLGVPGSQWPGQASESSHLWKGDPLYLPCGAAAKNKCDHECKHDPFYFCNINTILSKVCTFFIKLQKGVSIIEKAGCFLWATLTVYRPSVQGYKFQWPGGSS